MEALFHSFYFLSYAAIATIGGGVVVYAMNERRKAEGTPMNYTFIKVVSVLALAMWAGAGMTSFAYAA